MSALHYKTRGNTSPKGKPKVYFCCHPNDFEKYFDAISDEILAQQNCAVWYTTDASRDAELLSDLMQMQLFVVPVTANLLFTDNPAMEHAFSFARENHIPILPILLESGLEASFNQKCGELQYLLRNDPDPTAICYEEKLKNHLRSILIGDDLAEKIRAAFDAYIFLSYRKKDRKHAQELMKLIHQNPFCRDIAIWYDEFLTPGESFQESIKEALLKSDLFVLAVTPNLVNETNYIMTTEYPLARQEGKPILPAELVSTGREVLFASYADLPVPANAHDPKELSDALLAALRHIAIRENDSSAEHNFFIGLAYLTGIDVEVDHSQALSLITSAAEAGLPEAMRKLADMYKMGMGVSKAPETALHWQLRLCQKLKETYSHSGSDDDAHKLLDCLLDLGELQEDLRKYSDALSVYRQHLDIAREKLQQDPENIGFLRVQAFSYTKFGHVQKLFGDISPAFDAHSKALQYAQALAEETGETEDLVQLARCFINQGQFLEDQFRWQEAEQVYSNALDAMRQAKDADALPVRHITCHIYQKLGDMKKARDDIRSAMADYKSACALQEQLVVESGTVTNKINLSVFYNKIAHILYHTGDDCNAVDYYITAYETVSELRETSPSLDVDRQLMVCCAHLSEVNRRRKNYPFAEEFALDALNLSKTMADTVDTTDSHRDLRVSCEALADLYEETGDLSKAFNLRFFELEAGKKVADGTHSPKDLADLSSCYNHLAHLLRRLGRREEALSQYENAYRIRKTLSAQLAPSVILSAIHFSCGCIAEIYLDLGDLQNAKTYYREAVAVCEQLVSAQDTVSHLETLGTSYMELATVTSGSEQLELLRKAQTVYGQLCERKPENQKFQNDFDAICAAIADQEKKLSKQGGFFKKLFRK